MEYGGSAEAYTPASAILSAEYIRGMDAGTTPVPPADPSLAFRCSTPALTDTMGRILPTCLSPKLRP